jgi:hypothetical protein
MKCGRVVEIEYSSRGSINIAIWESRRIGMYIEMRARAAGMVNLV